MRAWHTVKVLFVAFAFGALMGLGLLFEAVSMLCDFCGHNIQRFAKWVFELK